MENNKEIMEYKTEPDKEETTQQIEPTDEEISEATAQAGKVGVLDPTFYIMLLLVALPADVLDWILDTLGLAAGGVGKFIGMGLDVVTFFIILWWMYSRGKKFEMPDRLRVKLAKLSKPAMKNIQSKISKRVASKALGRALTILIPALIIEEIPITGIFTSWIVSVISTIF